MMAVHNEVAETQQQVTVQHQIAKLEAQAENLGRQASRMFVIAGRTSSPEKRRALNTRANQLIREADRALDAAQKLLV